nr:hypothetical protein [Tanacetum cinerariifolium]
GGDMLSKTGLLGDGERPLAGGGEREQTFLDYASFLQVK